MSPLPHIKYRRLLAALGDSAIPSLGALAAIAAIAGPILVLAKDVARDTEWFVMLGAMAASILAALAGVSWIRFKRQLERERNVFLLYARPDIETARTVAALLREHGYRPWLDQDAILPGQRWKNAVDTALTKSSAVAVLISEHLEKSDHARDELARAVNAFQSSSTEITRIIPVRLGEATVPDVLQDIQWVDFGAENWETRFLNGLRAAILM